MEKWGKMQMLALYSHHQDNYSSYIQPIYEISCLQAYVLVFAIHQPLIHLCTPKNPNNPERVSKSSTHQPCSFLWSTEDLPSSVISEHRSLSHPRLASGSPDSHLYKTLSPVDIYYEMRTCPNSASSCAR